MREQEAVKVRREEKRKGGEERKRDHSKDGGTEHMEGMPHGIAHKAKAKRGS